MEVLQGALLSKRYLAEELLGRGGMGEIWRCRDLEQERDVALKTILPEFLSEPWAARLFHAEVTAVARLNHPGVIPVYDLARGEDGGAFLVMEYRAGRTLLDFVRPRRPWRVIREILEQVLAALAYAHARGVLHLDIKPDNVLVSRRGERLHATLLDFGVARVRRPGVGIERWLEHDIVLGTMAYMAPEQCSGVVERLGPWSDLYSVGAVAYELCAGHPPFRQEGAQGLLRRLHEPPPRLFPRGEDVPEEFIELCTALLAPAPADRPFAAADVLRTVRELDASEDQPDADERLLEPGPRLRTPEAFLPTRPSNRLAAQLLGRVVDPDELAEPIRAQRSPRVASGPIVAEAEEAFTAELSPPPPGAYGLYGLRDLPVLGRFVERRAIWGAVAEAVREGRPRAVFLEGPAGVGKSRLARDAVERSAEVGFCTTLQTSWSATGSGDEGLRGLLENLLDTRGLPREKVRARLEFWLERFSGQHAAYAREVELLLRPTPLAAPDADLPLRVAVDTIVRATRLRPAIVWLDDVQWSRGEAARLLDALFAYEGDLHVCVIATVRGDEIDDAAAHEAMVSRAGALRVRMDRLDDAATRQLVQGLLEIDDHLSELLSQRAEGNPLFAAQLLRQLVDAGALERRDGRYRLAHEFDLATVPADIGALWERRLAQSRAGRRELSALALVRDRVSLEVATELARILGPSIEDAVHLALASGLLRVEGGAYAWTHGLLRDHLVQGVPAGDAAPLHGAAAAALAPLVGREDVQEERARHLRAAGGSRDACEAMLEASLWSQRHADAGPRRTRAESVVSWAREAGFVDLQARGLTELAYLDAETGHVDRANAAIASARSLVAGEGPAASWLALRSSQVFRLQGRTEEGEQASEEALRLARITDTTEVETLALMQLGLDRARRKDREGAKQLLGETIAKSRSIGDRAGEAQATWILASAFEGKDALDLAESSVRLAREAGALRLELMGTKVWVGELWNCGERSRARAAARDLVDEAARRSLRQVVSLTALEAAGWAAAERDWSDSIAQRDVAVRWGAASGATIERSLLCAVDIAISLSRGDVVGAKERYAELERVRAGYSFDSLQNILRAAAEIAPDDLAAVLRRI